MRLRLSLSALSLALACGAAQAQVSDGVIRIGVMTDMASSTITGTLDMTRTTGTPSGSRFSTN